MPPPRRPDWRAAAARLAAAFPAERLDPAVRSWLEAAAPREGWGVAFSGGADSLALLLLLWAHFPRWRRRWRVLHFNHRLRGPESAADARFARRVAAGLGLRFVVGSWRERPAAPSEAAARSARLAFLEAQARVLWFGHQRDDVAETLLMRLARGSGTGGLAAPRPVHLFADGRVHLRPLLGLGKDDVRQALAAAGIRWREDSSNRAGTYFRNRVRLAVVPAWRAAAGRDAVAGAALSRQLLEEDDAALEALTAACGAVDARGHLRLGRLRGQPRAIRRRALQRWLRSQPGAGDPSRQAFEALLAALEAGQPTRQSLGRDGFAVLRGGVLRFECPVVRSGK